MNLVVESVAIYPHSCPIVGRFRDNFAQVAENYSLKVVEFFDPFPQVIDVVDNFVE